MSINHSFAKMFVGEYGGRYLDKNNILWRMIKGEWIGKRAVFTNQFAIVWIEETEEKDIRTYWHGKDADYSEIFV